MKTAVKILGFTAGFSLVVAVVYWALSYRGDPAGSWLLVFLFAAPLFMAAYLVLRGRALRPSMDDPEARHDDAAGEEVGEFSSGSAWPFVMAAGATLVLLGLVYGIWVLFPGVVVFVWSALGMIAESQE